MDYELEFCLNNGQYIDEGNFIIKTMINSAKLTTQRTGKSVLIRLKEPDGNETNSPLYYRQEKLLQSIKEDRINLT